MPFAEREAPPPPRRRVFVIAVLVGGSLLVYGAIQQLDTYQGAAKTQQEAIDFVPEVSVVAATLDAEPTRLTLPGQTAPLFQSTIYPRATGYIAERRVDIGSRVKKGDLLIRVSAPDLDQQLAEAKAGLAQSVAAQAQAKALQDQAKANLALSQLTSSRFQKLTTQGFESVQNNDNQKTTVETNRTTVEGAGASIKVATATNKAAQATAGRAQELAQFEIIEAPYDGVITTRNVEVGDLVNADSKTGSPLFTIAFDKVLRVTVDVPQANASNIKDGLAATAYLPQKPEAKFAGHITRSSIALRNASRTLETEVDVDNPTGALSPGAYVDVSFEIPRAHPNVVLPAEALIYNTHGIQVAIMRGDDQVHLQTVSIFRDFGKTVELQDGIKAGERVVSSPPVGLEEHTLVKVKVQATHEPGDK